MSLTTIKKGSMTQKKRSFSKWLNTTQKISLKDRIYNVIDPTIIQQFRLRKPECPFFKPNQQQKQQQNASRKGSYHSEQNNQHNVYKYTNASFVSQQLVPNHPVPQTFFPTTRVAFK